MKENNINIKKMVQGSINQVLFGNYIQDWFMTEAERCILIMLLNEIKPQCAIEIGTYMGGSLSVLSRFSNKVYTLDVDPTCSERLGRKFSNAEFVTGLSQETLPVLLQRLKENNNTLEFVLIDGDHSRNGVKRDIENLLKFQPTRPLYIIIHDSFNPDCRQGMIEANWAINPYVHFVEIDFVAGIFSHTPDCYRQMWCGFALALMLPLQRTSELKINAKEDLLFQTICKNSVHCFKEYSKWHPLRIAFTLKRRMQKLIGNRESNVPS